MENVTEKVSSFKLEVGQMCWIEYKEVKYLGVEVGKYKVELKTKDGFEIKYVNYQPCVDDFNPPQYLKDASGLFYVYKERTLWLRDGGTFYYKYLIPSDTFKGYDYFNRESVKKLTEVENPFLDEEELCRLLDAVHEGIRPIEKEIKSLQNKLSEVKEKFIPIRKRCWHQWDEGAEEETGRNFLGQGKKKTSTCQVCGFEKTIYYSSL